MSNINIKSDMGGGNSLNIIRIPSVNEAKNIILNSDLNGSITPGNSNTWQYDRYYVMLYQNNKNENAFVTKNGAMAAFYDKSYISIFGEGSITFNPVIEYRE